MTEEQKQAQRNADNERVRKRRQQKRRAAEENCVDDVTDEQSKSRAERVASVAQSRHATMSTSLSTLKIADCLYHR